MLSVFSRKSKQRGVHKRGSITLHSPEDTMHLKSREAEHTIMVDHSRKCSMTEERLRASSASPQPHCSSSHRRLPGISVTFESTLPTQVWQASPSPSPPPILNSPLIPWNETRMSLSVSDEVAMRAMEAELPQLRHTHRHLRSGSGPSDRSWPPPRRERDVEDLSSEDDEYDENALQGKHSITTNSNSLSTCSSSDDSVESCPRRVGQKTNSSTTTTGTTDSSSSLEIPIPSRHEAESSTSGALKSRKSRCQPRKSRHSEPQVREERKKRRTVAMVPKSVQPILSSSSSTSEDDLEAFGWDEKTISALTNRVKGRLSLQPRTPIFSTSANGKNRRTLDNCSQLHMIKNTTMLSPQANPRYQTDMVVLTQPQSCVLTRRANHQRFNSQVNYSSTESPKPLMSGACRHFSPPHQYQPHHQQQQQQIDRHIGRRPVSSELLAIVTRDYKPETQWAHQYKVLTVRQGDYVSVLSQPLASRPTNPSEKTDRTQDQGDGEARTWLYVRRWCVDHLVTTGPPGFVPRVCCRLLSSNEILNLWHRNSLLRGTRSNVSDEQATLPSTALGLDSNVRYQPHPQPMLPVITSTMAQIQLHEIPFHSPTSTISFEASPYSLLRNHGDNFHSVQPVQLTVHTHANLPPPPPGFGSGGSVGSETEDRDSGRGPSSGSEWGSGRGGSSNVTLNHTMAEQPVGMHAERARVPMINQVDQTKRESQKLADESQSIGWYSHAGSIISSEQCSSTREDDLCSPDSGLQVQVDGDSADRTPKLLVKSCTSHTLAAPNGTNNMTTILANDRDSPKSTPITFATRTNCTPVLEMRPTTGTLTLYTREAALSPSNDTLAMSTTTTTCATVVDYSVSFDEVESISGSDPPNSSQHTSNVNPSCWEPYKTVIHVNENTLEKFTLV